jgi:hypothetical protein
MLSDREEQLKPLGLGKRNKALGTVIDGVECLAGNAIDCAKTVPFYFNVLFLFFTVWLISHKSLGFN